MNFLDQLIQGKVEEFKQAIFARLSEAAAMHLNDYKKEISENTFEVIAEAAPRRNPNIMRMGKIQKIRRRIRRNAKGRIIVQKNVKRSGVKGYRVSGNRVVRIPTAQRLRKALLLKRSWKTTRKSKLRRTLMKRKMSMQRRKGLGLR